MKRKSNLVDPHSLLRLAIIQMMWKWKGTLFSGKRIQYGVDRDEDRQEQRIMTVYEDAVMNPLLGVPN